MGKIGKAKSGKWVGAGHTPYGYRRSGLRGDVRLEIEPDEAAIVRRIYDLYTGRDGHERHGIRAISEALNTEGVLSPTGGTWWWSTVKRILSNPDYTGEFEYMGVAIQLPDLAIVSREQYNVARRLRAANKENARRNRKHEYALSNLIRCACGRKMFGEAGNRYVCTSRNLPAVLRECRYGKVYANSIEPIIWDHLRSLLSDEQLSSGAGVAGRRAAKQRAQSAGRLDEIERKLARLRNQVRQLMGRFGDDETLAAIAEEEIRARARDIQGLELERDELLQDNETAEIDAARRANLLANRAALREMIDDPDEQVRRRAIEALEVRVKMEIDGQAGRAIVVSCLLAAPKRFKVRHNPGR